MSMKGTTTFSITTLSIIILGTMTFSMTIKNGT
jgi:hypothetical protein